jgi:intracellular sulfur oxidation DsrE/DsrF family protein
MSEHTLLDTLPRRSFFTRMVAGASAFGAAFGASQVVEAQAAAAAWQPARHAEDDWFDQTTAKHRFFMDTTSPDALGQALFFARNVFTANASGYALTDADIAQIICVRHQSTSFAFTDAMWAKYGAALSERAGGFVDPKTKQVPTTNLYQATGYGDTLRNVGVTLDAVLKRGVRLAVCAMSTRATASLIAQKSGTRVDDVFKELTDHLVLNGHMVPAGIVAVNRAQERGYSFSYVT